MCSGDGESLRSCRIVVVGGYVCSGDGESLRSCGIVVGEGMCAVVMVKVYVIVE